MPRHLADPDAHAVRVARIASAAAAAVLLLQGCATTPLTAEDMDGRVVCDESRMAAVDHAARRQFMDLRWVNCPTATVRVQRE